MPLAELYSRAAAPVLRERYPVLDALYAKAAAAEGSDGENNSILDYLYNTAVNIPAVLGLYKAAPRVGQAEKILNDWTKATKLREKMDNEGEQLDRALWKPSLSGRRYPIPKNRAIRHKKYLSVARSLIPGVRVDGVTRPSSYRSIPYAVFYPDRNLVEWATRHPADLAHELGHAQNKRSMQRLLGDKRGNRTYQYLTHVHEHPFGINFPYGDSLPERLLRRLPNPVRNTMISAAKRATPFNLGLAAYALGGETGRNWSWLVPLAMHTPRLIDEGAASIRGLRNFRKPLRIRSSTRPRARLATAFGSYLAQAVAPALGLGAAGLAQNFGNRAVSAFTPFDNARSAGHSSQPGGLSDHLSLGADTLSGWARSAYDYLTGNGGSR